jgi:hypothetical protein
LSYSPGEWVIRGYAENKLEGDCLTLDSKQAITTVAAFGSLLASSVDFAWLFVEFSATHFFLQTATFYQLSKSSNGFLNGFSVSDQ